MPEEFKLTRSEAHNPAVYRDIKERAAKAGATLQIIEDPQLDASGQPVVEPRDEFPGLDVCWLRDRVILRRDAARDPRQYRRVSEHARSTHRQVQMCESFAELDDDTKARVRDAVAGKDPGKLGETFDPLQHEGAA
jgi:hypothetical protein